MKIELAHHIIDIFTKESIRVVQTSSHSETLASLAGKEEAELTRPGILAYPESWRARSFRECLECFCRFFKV